MIDNRDYFDRDESVEGCFGYTVNMFNADLHFLVDQVVSEAIGKSSICPFVRLYGIDSEESKGGKPASVYGDLKFTLTQHINIDDVINSTALIAASSSALPVSAFVVSESYMVAVENDQESKEKFLEQLKESGGTIKNVPGVKEIISIQGGMINSKENGAIISLERDADGLFVVTDVKFADHTESMDTESRSRHIARFFLKLAALIEMGKNAKKKDGKEFSPDGFFGMER